MPDRRKPRILIAQLRERPENERRLFELFRSRAPGIETPLKVLTDAGVPRGDLISRVLCVAAEYDQLADASHELKEKVAVKMRKLVRLADNAAKLAKKLEHANEMVFAQLRLPEQLTDWQQEMLALPEKLKFYAGSLRYLLEHAPPRPRGRTYIGEASLCRWVQLEAGEKFHDGLYDHLAELLQSAAVFWHPDQKEPARDHFSAEALRRREKRSKRRKQKPAS